MKTLMEDLRSPLDQVSRNWLRRTAIILLLPIFIVISIGIGVVGIFQSVYRFASGIW